MICKQALVRIVEGEEVTHYAFFVQIKAIEHIEFNQDGKTFSYRIDKKNIENWRHFWEPVILTIWDVRNDVVYWEIIQDHFDSDTTSLRGKGKTSIHIHTDNILDEDGLKRIYVNTRKRFERFEREKNGTKELVALLEERTDLKIEEYDMQFGLLIISKPDGTKIMRLFGEALSMVEDMKEELSTLRIMENEPIESVSLKAIYFYSNLVEKMQGAKSITLQNSLGEEKLIFDNLEDFERYLDIKSEIRSYNRLLKGDI